jgi:hypothetical protein
MPQPVRDLKLKDLDTHAEALVRRPELAARIAAIATQWTRIETALADLFVVLLGREEEAALAVYLELIDRNVRKAAFDALARIKLDSGLVEEFELLYKKVAKHARKRNRIVHGYWAVSDNYPDGLLLFDVNDVHRENFAYKNQVFETWDEENSWRENSMSRVEINKYTINDLAEILVKLGDLEHQVEIFLEKVWYVRRKGAPKPP